MLSLKLLYVLVIVYLSETPMVSLMCRLWPVCCVRSRHADILCSPGSVLAVSEGEAGYTSDNFSEQALKIN